MNDKNKKVEGFYFNEQGTPYTSVTQVLGIIDKSRPLMYWAMEIMFYGVKANPEIKFEEARALPFASNKSAKDRGSTIHSFVEAYKKGHPIPLKDVPPQFKPFATAFNSWATTNDVEIVSQEKTLYSNKYQYAGTYDMVAKLNGKGEVWLIDIKTGKQVYDEVELQLSAYKAALEENGQPIDKLGVVLLKEDGDFIFEEKTSKYNLEAFLAAKKLWEWKNKNLVKKIMETYQSKQLVMN